MQVVAMEDEEVQYDAQSAHGINVRAAPSFGTADGITGASMSECVSRCRSSMTHSPHTASTFELLHRLVLQTASQVRTCVRVCVCVCVCVCV